MDCALTHAYTLPEACGQKALLQILKKTGRWQLGRLAIYCTLADANEMWGEKPNSSTRCSGERMICQPA